MGPVFVVMASELALVGLGELVAVALGAAHSHGGQLLQRQL